MEFVIIFFIFDNKKKSINYNTIDEFQYCEDIEDFQKLGKSNDMITTNGQKDQLIYGDCIFSIYMLQCTRYCFVFLL
jgi:hypothetical protein